MRILVLFSLLFSVSAMAQSDFFVKSKEVHQVKILNQGLPSLELRLQMIERAKESIVAEYFIYDTDPSSRLFNQALAKKAKEGVKVRVLLDAFMTKPQIDPFHLRELELAGIEIKFFNTAPLIRVVKAQYRNHRKLLAIDNTEAIIGGRNIADEYFDLREDFNFVDQELWVKGPIVANIMRTFDVFWEAKLSVKGKWPRKPRLSDIKYRVYTSGMLADEQVRFNDKLLKRSMKALNQDLKRWEQRDLEARQFLDVNSDDLALREKVANFSEPLLAKITTGSCEEITFISDLPEWGKRSRKRRKLKYEIFKRMEESKQRLYIDSPYFITDRQSKKVLKRSFSKDKKLRLITNGLFSTDAIYVNAVFNSSILKWIKKGLDVNTYRGVLPENYPVLTDKIKDARWGTHSKSFIFDDSFLVGSYNFDPRSSLYDMELAIFCDGSPELLQEMLTMFNQKIEKSNQLSSRKDINNYKFKKIKFKKVLAYYLVKPFAMLLRNLL
jgi:cardiolipin synthase C